MYGCCQVEGLRNADHSPGVLLLDAINERLAGEAALAKPDPVPAATMAAVHLPQVVTS
jgi:hypothetical protein